MCWLYASVNNFALREPPSYEMFSLGADSFSITALCPLESWVESRYLSAFGFVSYHPPPRVHPPPQGGNRHLAHEQ